MALMPNRKQRLVQFRPQFQRNLKRLSKKYRNIRSDVSPLIEQLRNGNTPGDQVPGTGYTTYKARAANSDARRGKSGGYRIIYQLIDQEIALLLIIYSKSDQEDISASEIAAIIENPWQV
jgi:mRNA-degrading endonuclease RelE of RelBE toxin-antitoxin system